MRKGHHHFHFLTFLGVVLFVGLFAYKVFFVNDFFGRLIDRITGSFQPVRSQQAEPAVIPLSSPGTNTKVVILSYPDGRTAEMKVSGKVSLQNDYLKVKTDKETVYYWLPKGTKVVIKEKD